MGGIAEKIGKPPVAIQAQPSGLMLDHEPDIKYEGSGPGDEQRLTQPNPTHQLGSDPERQDQQADELEQAAQAVSPRQGRALGLPDRRRIRVATPPGAARAVLGHGKTSMPGAQGELTVVG
jgi:hypothetical protein